MTCSALRLGTLAPSFADEFFKGSVGFGQVRQACSSRKFAAARTVPGSTDRAQAILRQIAIDLDGRIDTVHGDIRSSFEVAPDAPVSKFVLEMKGGKKGLLENSTNLCTGINRARVKMTGQSDAIYDFNSALGDSCGHKKAEKRSQKGKHRAKADARAER
jgi:hypothetical protein